MKIIIKLKNDLTELTLNFQTEQERDLQFDLISRSMSKVTLDVWSSPEIAIKVSEVVYIRKEN